MSIEVWNMTSTSKEVVDNENKQSFIVSVDGDMVTIDKTTLKTQPVVINIYRLITMSEEEPENTILQTVSEVAMEMYKKLKTFKASPPSTENVRKAGVVLTNNHSQILLVQGRDTGKWSFPKGKIKYGESIIQCAQRECFEETGIRLTIPKGCERFMSSGHVYFFVDYHQKIECNPIAKREIVRCKWFTPKELNGLPSSEMNCCVRWFVKRHL